MYVYLKIKRQPFNTFSQHPPSPPSICRRRKRKLSKLHWKSHYQRFQRPWISRQHWPARYFQPAAGWLWFCFCFFFLKKSLRIIIVCASLYSVVRSADGGLGQEEEDGGVAVSFPFISNLLCGNCASTPPLTFSTKTDIHGKEFWIDLHVYVISQYWVLNGTRSEELIFQDFCTEVG